VNYINSIPDYDEHIKEAEDFLYRLTDSRAASIKWSTLWKQLNVVCIRLVSLERKWKGYKKSTGIAPKHVIKKDIDVLVHRLRTDIPDKESAIEWGIRSTQSLIDTFPSLLPYFTQTYFASYIENISGLLQMVVERTKHSNIMKLLREVRKHPDTVTGAQSLTNEMVDRYKRLADNKLPVTRREIVDCIDTYQKLCGIYEKDIVLCYCLLQLKETGDRTTYADAHPESRHPQGRNNFVRRRMPLFGRQYDLYLRNANAHTDIEADSIRLIVNIYVGREKTPKTYTYGQIVSMTREMSALVAAFLLLPVVLANNDWRMLQSLLQ